MPERVAVEVGRSGGSPVGSQCGAVEGVTVSNAPKVYSDVAVEEISRYRRGADTPGVAIDAEPLGRVAGEVASVAPVMHYDVLKYRNPVYIRYGVMTFSLIKTSLSWLFCIIKMFFRDLKLCCAAS